MRAAGTLLLFGILAVNVCGQMHKSRLNNAAGVELRLMASKNVMRIGDSPIVLRVELWNRGKNDFWASRNLLAITSQPAYLEVYVQNANGHMVPLEQMDAILSSQAVNDSWTCISPGHYYGLELRLDASLYGNILTPGKHKLVARYVSNGGWTAPSPEWDVPSHKIWEGVLEFDSDLDWSCVEQRGVPPEIASSGAVLRA